MKCEHTVKLRYLPPDHRGPLRAKEHPQAVKFDGEGDHIHLLVNHPPKVTVAALVNSLKTPLPMPCWDGWMCDKHY